MHCDPLIPISGYIVCSSTSQSGISGYIVCSSTSYSGISGYIVCSSTSYSGISGYIFYCVLQHQLRWNQWVNCVLQHQLQWNQWVYWVYVRSFQPGHLSQSGSAWPMPITQRRNHRSLKGVWSLKLLDEIFCRMAEHLLQTSKGKSCYMWENQCKMYLIQM